MNLLKLILLILIPIVVSWVFVTTVISHYYNPKITAKELILRVPKSIVLEFK